MLVLGHEPLRQTDLNLGAVVLGVVDAAHGGRDASLEQALDVASTVCLDVWTRTPARARSRQASRTIEPKDVVARGAKVVVEREGVEGCTTVGASPCCHVCFDGKLPLSLEVVYAAESGGELWSVDLDEVTAVDVGSRQDDGCESDYSRLCLSEVW